MYTEHFFGFLLLKVAWIYLPRFQSGCYFWILKRTTDNILFHKPWRSMFFSLTTTTIPSLSPPPFQYVLSTFYNAILLQRFVLLKSDDIPSPSACLQLFQWNEIPEIGKEYVITLGCIGMDKCIEIFVLISKNRAIIFILLDCLINPVLENYLS